MTNRSNSRRQFLTLSGSAALAGLAGCTSGIGSVLPNGADGDGDGGTNGDGGEYGPPELAHETEYDSREEFAQPGDSFDDFEDEDAWEHTREGEVTVDEGECFDGSQSLRLTAEDGANVGAERTLEQPTDFTDTDVSLAVRTTTPNDVTIDVLMYDVYGGYAHHQLRHTSYDADEPGWFRICPGVFETSGVPFDRERVERIEVLIHNTGDAEVWVDDLRTHDTPDTGYVVLSWDDAYADYYETVAPMHDEYGVNAVLAAVRSWTRAAAEDEALATADDGGRRPSMTVDQLVERQDAGDQIVAHGTHVRLGSRDADAVDRALSRDKRWAVDNGFEGGHYIVYPHNSFDETVLDVASNYYYAGGFNQSGHKNLTGVYGFDPLALPRTIGNDLEIAKQCIDAAVEHHQCTVLNFHAFDLDNTIPRDDYRELLEYIDERGDDLEVIDFDDLWTMRREGH